jgi:hypothetical protein
LLIENAIASMPKTDATEKVAGTIEAIPTVQKVTHGIPAGFRKKNLIEAVACQMVFESQLPGESPSITVITVFCLVHPHAVPAILAECDVEGILHVLTGKEMIAGNVGVTESLNIFMHERTVQYG